MLPRFFIACGCAVAWVIAAGAQAPENVAHRRVPFRSPEIWLPLTSFSIGTAMAEVAWAVDVPIGYEALPDAPWQPAPSEASIRTAGLTLFEILDAIVTRQPRYQWSLDDGVVHLRPKIAIEDPGNILNRPLDEFVLNDATLPVALREIRFALGPEARQGGILGSGPGPSALGRRRFSVSLGRTTLLAALDAIVKAHGASSWRVTYEEDRGVPYPDRISFQTFDGWGATW